MLRKFISLLIRCSIFAIILSSRSHAQIDDMGIWTGITFQTKITRQLEVSLTEQLRLKNDASRISLILSDIGLSYDVTKKLKVGLNYRYIKSNQDNYFSNRHRFYADIAWKEKIKSISITLRERVQKQYSDYFSSETGKIPVWVLRSKLTAKLDLDKKYFPYLSGEIFYLLDNESNEYGLTQYRYEAGINYDINRLHSINPFLIFQKSHSSKFNELIYGIMYTFSY